MTAQKTGILVAPNESVQAEGEGWQRWIHQTSDCKVDLLSRDGVGRYGGAPTFAAWVVDDDEAPFSELGRATRTWTEKRWTAPLLLLGGEPPSSFSGALAAYRRTLKKGAIWWLPEACRWNGARLDTFLEHFRPWRSPDEIKTIIDVTGSEDSVRKVIKRLFHGANLKDDAEVLLDELGPEIKEDCRKRGVAWPDDPTPEQILEIARALKEWANRPGTAGGGGGEPRRVLVIDDRMDEWSSDGTRLKEVLTEAFDWQECKVVFCSHWDKRWSDRLSKDLPDGGRKRFLDAIRKDAERFDLVLVDQVLLGEPDQGLDVIRAIREIEGDHDVPVSVPIMAMTAADSAAGNLKGLRSEEDFDRRCRENLAAARDKSFLLTREVENRSGRPYGVGAIKDLSLPTVRLWIQILGKEEDGMSGSAKRGVDVSLALTRGQTVPRWVRCASGKAIKQEMENWAREAALENLSWGTWSQNPSGIKLAAALFTLTSLPGWRLPTPGGLRFREKPGKHRSSPAYGFASSKQGWKILGLLMCVADQGALISEQGLNSWAKVAQAYTERGFGPTDEGRRGWGRDGKRGYLDVDELIVSFHGEAPVWGPGPDKEKTWNEWLFGERATTLIFGEAFELPEATVQALSELWAERSPDEFLVLLREIEHATALLKVTGHQWKKAVEGKALAQGRANYRSELHEVGNQLGLSIHTVEKLLALAREE